MLLSRSKRSVGSDGKTERLVLADNWQLVVIAFIMLGLLRVIFPQKALVDMLKDQEHLDELALSYIDNLRRAEPNNTDLTILFARVQTQQLSSVALERLLQPVLQLGDMRQRGETRLLLLDSYERALDKADESTVRAQWLTKLVALLRDASKDDMSPQLAGAYAAAAFRLEQPDLAVTFLRRLDPTRPAAALAGYAKDALSQGQHALAAEYFLLARKQTKNRDEARDYFQQGIGALMAASRFERAMQAAQRELGDLADDAPTLRYLARAALAAGDPKSAARYAQRLVFTGAASMAAEVVR